MKMRSTKVTCHSGSTLPLLVDSTENLPEAYGVNVVSSPQKYLPHEFLDLRGSGVDRTEVARTPERSEGL